MRGQWTNNTIDPQGELLKLLDKAGGEASVASLYRNQNAWGIRTQTIKALIRKGKVTCDSDDIWNGILRKTDASNLNSQQPTTSTMETQK